MKIDLPSTLTVEIEPVARWGNRTWEIVVRFGRAEVARYPWDSPDKPEQYEADAIVAEVLAAMFPKEQP